LNKRWRRFQAMAYGQPGIADAAQYRKKDVGTKRTIDGTSLPSARNPQSVENLKSGDWKLRAKALGLQVPAELGHDQYSGKMLLAWAQWAQAKGQLTSAGLNLPQLYNIGKTVGLPEGAVYFALWRLFQAGIVRFAKY